MPSFFARKRKTRKGEMCDEIKKVAGGFAGTASDTAWRSVPGRNREKGKGTENTGCIYIGVMKDGEGSGVMLDLEPEIMDALEQGADLKQIAESLLEEYDEKRKLLLDGVFGSGNFQEIRGTIFYALENRKAENRDFSQIPHKAYLDMEIIFYMMVETENHVNYHLISNEDADVWGVDVEEIWQAAQENTPKLLGTAILTCREAIQRMDMEKKGSIVEKIAASLAENEKIQTPAFILTNDYGLFGASTILYEGTLKQIAAVWNDDILVLPTSIHDVIILPFSRSGRSVAEWREMIYEMNREGSNKERALTDSVYFYDRKEETLQIAEMRENEMK